VHELSNRRIGTKDRIRKICSELKTAEDIAKGKACVYATGSFGRLEASEHSDLDLFIVGKNDGKERKEGKQGSLLNRLDEICIKADLIEVTRREKIQEFSGEGRYLVHYSLDELTKTLGTREDDVTNTFTARLLLLLESRPLLEAQVYRDVTEEVIAAYWGDYEDHKNDFMPAFLANDILRLWRTFCVNYESTTKIVPEEEKAKRKLKNYKLKHSRLLTCYSALLYLLAIYTAKKTVSPANALEMIALTPTERLEWLLEHKQFIEAQSGIQSLLDQYNRFLQTTNREEDALLLEFQKKEWSKERMSEASDFGDKVFAVLNEIGQKNSFHRLLVV